MIASSDWSYFCRPRARASATSYVSSSGVSGSSLGVGMVESAVPMVIRYLQLVNQR